MNVLGCTANLNPCPEQNQVWIDIASTIDFGLLGITPASITKALSFGFGFVIMAFSIGFAAGVFIRIIRKA